VNMSVFKDLVEAYKLRQISRIALFLACIVLPMTHLAPAHGSKASKIPDGEARFTSEQLDNYYLVYKKPDVRYLRTVFNSYLNSSESAEQGRQLLSKWSNEYFRSKFMVLSREDNTFGGTLITILFQDRPDKIFVALVYPEGDARKLTLRKFDVGDFSEEDLRRIKTLCKKLIEDKVHAM
jgi:hypothetical protein